MPLRFFATEIRYFESARIAHFNRLGKALSILDETPAFDFTKFMNATGIGPILSFTSCKFRMPGSYPDALIIGSRIDLGSICDDRFVMKYAVYSEEKGKFLAEGEGLVVMYDYAANTKAKISPQFLNAIKYVENEAPTFSK